jgi:hypothetical protein
MKSQDGKKKSETSTSEVRELYTRIVHDFITGKTPAPLLTNFFPRQHVWLRKTAKTLDAKLRELYEKRNISPAAVLCILSETQDSLDNTEPKLGEISSVSRDLEKLNREMMGLQRDDSHPALRMQRLARIKGARQKNLRSKDLHAIDSCLSVVKIWRKIIDAHRSNERIKAIERVHDATKALSQACAVPPGDIKEQRNEALEQDFPAHKNLLSVLAAAREDEFEYSRCRDLDFDRMDRDLSRLRQNIKDFQGSERHRPSNPNMQQCAWNLAILFKHVVADQLWKDVGEIMTGAFPKDWHRWRWTNADDFDSNRHKELARKLAGSISKRRTRPYLIALEAISLQDGDEERLNYWFESVTGLTESIKNERRVRGHEKTPTLRKNLKAHFASHACRPRT